LLHISEIDWKRLEAVEEAGAFAVVLECVPSALAQKITESNRIDPEEKAMLKTLRRK